MSKLSLKGNPSGTGNFSIEAPNSNVDRTLALPDEAGTVLTDVSDIESQVKTATNATGSAPVYACRAWVNFDGTGTVSIRESGNVSSITDNGTGNYTVNFSTNMPDVNYVITQSARSSPNATYIYPNSVPNSASQTPSLFAKAEGGGLVDAEYAAISIFR